MIDYVLLNLAIQQSSLICSGIKQPLWNVLHGYRINFGLRPYSAGLVLDWFGLVSQPAAFGSADFCHPAGLG
jgi:hypothetical protein